MMFDVTLSCSVHCHERWLVEPQLLHLGGWEGGREGGGDEKGCRGNRVCIESSATFSSMTSESDQ